MFRRTPPRPLRPTLGNTAGLITRFSGSSPININRRLVGNGGHEVPHEVMKVNRFISQLLDYTDKHAKSVCHQPAQRAVA